MDAKYGTRLREGLRPYRRQQNSQENFRTTKM